MDNIEYKIEKSFSWRQLTPSGALIQMKRWGPDWDEHGLKDEYDTEEEAMQDYIKIQKECNGYFAEQLVLITFYHAIPAQ